MGPRPWRPTPGGIWAPVAPPSALQAAQLPLDKWLVAITQEAGGADVAAILKGRMVERPPHAYRSTVSVEREDNESGALVVTLRFELFDYPQMTALDGVAAALKGVAQPDG